MIDSNSEEFANRIIYYEEDVPYITYLMSFKEQLTKEFLDNHPEWDNRHEPLQGVEITHQTQYHNGKWKMTPFSYQVSPKKKSTEFEHNLQKYPTACKITEELRGKTGTVMYSILEPKCELKRHTGPENRDGSMLRIHIPLIIPPGDVFIEIDGNEENWSRPFGFNNQYVHSAYNNTKHRRLIFMIDIERIFLGLPPGKPWLGADHESKVVPFVRKMKEVQ